MAEAEVVEAGEEKPKKPILKIILGIVGLIVLLCLVSVGTLFASGFFSKPPPNPDTMLEGSTNGGHGAPADAHGAPAKKDAHGAPADAHGAPAKKDSHGNIIPEKGGKTSKGIPQTAKFEYSYYQIEKPFLVNLTGTKKMMSVQLAVMTRYDDRVFANIKKHEFALRSEVMDQMRLVTEPELAKPEFRKNLSATIRNTMNALLEKYEDFGGIEDIYYTSFVVQ